MKKIETLFENDDYIILNKPSGLLSIPDHYANPNNLRDLLSREHKDIFVVHRIDKDTSGCIVYAKNAEAHKHASMAFENHEVSKEYQTIIHGQLSEKSGTVKQKLAPHPSKQNIVVVNNNYGKEAITDYEVVEEFKSYSLVSCKIQTGRMHQIRVHMEYLGHPILCDPFYSASTEFFISSIKRRYNLAKDELNERPILKRLALHAHKLSFKDIKGNTIEAQAELFKDMRASIQQMRKWNS